MSDTNIELRTSHCASHDFPGGFCTFSCPERRKLDWVVVGGESGPGARPMHPDWARSLRDQCTDAGGVLDEEALRAELKQAKNLLADLVIKATEYGTQDGDFVANYLLPTGPIHRAIPWLEERGIVVRPGFDGRKPAAEPSREAGLDPNAPPIEAVLHALGDVIAPDKPTGRTRCPLCKTLPIGHEGECEP